MNCFFDADHFIILQTEQQEKQFDASYAFDESSRSMPFHTYGIEFLFELFKSLDLILCFDGGP